MSFDVQRSRAKVNKLQSTDIYININRMTWIKKLWKFTFFVLLYISNLIAYKHLYNILDSAPHGPQSLKDLIWCCKSLLNSLFKKFFFYYSRYRKINAKSSVNVNPPSPQLAQRVIVIEPKIWLTFCVCPRCNVSFINSKKIQTDWKFFIIMTFQLSDLTLSFIHLRNSRLIFKRYPFVFVMNTLFTKFINTCHHINLC